MARRKTDTLSEQLRGAIRADGRTPYRLWRDCGVDQGLLRRFLAGQRDITLRTADRIAKAVGVVLGPK